MARFVQRLWKKSKKWRTKNARVLLTAGSVSTVVFLLRFFSLLQFAELAAFDVLVNLRPPEPQDDRIRVIAVDQKDLNTYKWPLEDHLLAELLQKIDKQKPTVVGLDIIRDRPIGEGKEAFQDQILAMPNFIGIEALNANPEFYTQPLPVMRKPDKNGEMKKGVGFNNIQLDTDGIIRRSLLFWKFQGETRRSLSLQLAEYYLKEQKGISSEGHPKDKPKYLKLGSAVFYDLRDFHSLYGFLDRETSNYQIISNLSNPNRVKSVTLTDVMEERIPPDFFRDRIVLIGDISENTKDLFLSPFRNRPTGKLKRIGGVQIHASFTSEILSAVLDNRPLLRAFPLWLDSIWILVWGIFGSAAVWRWRSPIRGGTALLTSMGGIFCVSYILFFNTGWMFPLIPCLLSLVGSAIVVTTYLAHQERELSRSKEFFNLIIDNIPDPVFVKDTNFTFTVVNDAFCQLINRPAKEIIGQSDYDLFNQDEAIIFRTQEQNVLQNSQSQENEESITDFSGNTYFAATKRSLHKDGAGNIFLVGVIRDITERKKLEADLRRTAEELTRSNDELKASEKRLRHLANHDPLTGLPNRKLFHEKLEQLIEWGEENQQLVGLLFLDLDGFKAVNDNLGHDMGDILLKAVSQRIKNCLRISDVVSRLGGDEFTVLLPGIKNPMDSTIVSQKILTTVSAPYTLQGHIINVTTSIGISVYPIDGDSATELIKLADIAMYDSKRNGRNKHSMTEKLANLG